MAQPDIDLVGYELVWPPAVFAEELVAVQRSTNWRELTEFLLE